MSRMSMTKEQLKNALVQHRVPLPPGSAKKEEFQKLYDLKVRPLQSNKAGNDFSSDEETEPAEANGVDLEKKFLTMEEIRTLSDHHLFEFCVKVFGRDSVGPIMASTRGVYQNKLAGHFTSSDSDEHVKNLNGSGEANGTNGFSDSDDEAKVETASRASRTSRSSRNSVGLGDSPRRRRGAAKQTKEEKITEEESARSEEAGADEELATGHRSRGGARRSETPRDTLAGSVTTSRQTMRSNRIVEEPGVSYFNARPGYATETTDNVLPLKPRLRKTPNKEEKPAKTSFWMFMLSLLGAVLVISLAVAMFYNKEFLTTIFLNSNESTDDKDVIDSILKDIQDEEVQKNINA